MLLNDIGKLPLELAVTIGQNILAFGWEYGQGELQKGCSRLATMTMGCEGNPAPRVDVNSGEDMAAHTVSQANHGV